MTFPTTLTAAQVRACVRAIGWSAIFDQISTSSTLYVIVGSNILNQRLRVCVLLAATFRARASYTSGSEKQELGFGR